MTNTNPEFAVFIVTYGRPNHQHTERALRKQGYTGAIYYVVDDKDETLSQYQAKYEDAVCVFSKDAYQGTFDLMDNFPQQNTVTYARNAVWDIAKSLSVRSFLMLDDDYEVFAYAFVENRYATSRHTKIQDLDRAFDAYLTYLENSPCHAIAMLQSGDFIGGAQTTSLKTINAKRKVMNTFFCLTDRPFAWTGRMNDDVNTYIQHGHRGLLFLSPNYAFIKQKETQQASGGLTDMYEQFGTYTKSFYSVMAIPSATSVRAMGMHKRLHHSIDWDKTVPKILTERHRKAKDAPHEASQ